MEIYHFTHFHTTSIFFVHSYSSAIRSLVLFVLDPLVPLDLADEPGREDRHYDVGHQEPHTDAGQGGCPRLQPPGKLLRAAVPGQYNVTTGWLQGFICLTLTCIPLP